MLRNIVYISTISCVNFINTATLKQVEQYLCSYFIHCNRWHGFYVPWQSGNVFDFDDFFVTFGQKINIRLLDPRNKHSSLMCHHKNYRYLAEYFVLKLLSTHFSIDKTGLDKCSISDHKVIIT